MDPDEFDVALARQLGRPVTRERVITVDGVSRIESTTADPDGTITKRHDQLRVERDVRRSRGPLAGATDRPRT